MANLINYNVLKEAGATGVKQPAQEGVVLGKLIAEGTKNVKEKIKEGTEQVAKAMVGGGSPMPMVGGTSPLKWDPFGFKKRRKADEAAKAELNKEIKNFEKLDTSNLQAGAKNMYSNMENVYEDQTINQRAAQFANEKFQQSQSNILDAVQGSGGFNAGNIQALANQGALSAQGAAADIGRQEAANQAKMLGESARLQGLERQGEDIAMQRRVQGMGESRSLQYQKQQGMLAARTGQAQAAAQARQQGIQNAIGVVSAIGSVASAVGGFLPKGAKAGGGGAGVGGTGAFGAKSGGFGSSLGVSLSDSFSTPFQGYKF